MYMSSAPWNRLLRREFLLENHIRFPEGCLTEDITFNVACNCLAKTPIGTDCMGYCNYMNADSVSRSHKFAAMKYDEMPFSYIEKNCMLNKYAKGSQEGRAYQASICEQLTLLACVFSRDSDKVTKINARKTSAMLVRNYMANYIRSAYEYNCHMNNRMAMKIIFFCYMLSIWFHMDKLYCALVHAVLRVFMK